MNSIAIIAEYNPFHCGHRHMLRQLRRLKGPQCALVVIMSGSFVQRGEPALFDKWSRAAWAIAGGADCVIELPVLYVLSSAGGFASGAVRLANRLGCAGLSCGVEEGTASEYAVLAAAAKSPLSLPLTDGTGQPYGMYLSKAISRLVPPKTAALLQHPNALLAVEYVKAIQQYAPAMAFLPILRHSRHDAASPDGVFASASAIRQAVAAGHLDALSPYVPTIVYDAITHYLSDGQYTDYVRYGDMVLYQNRFKTPEELILFPAFSEGLENRWQRIMSQAPTWQDAVSRLKTRRYSHSRLRRMGAYTAIGISRADMEEACRREPPYARVLALSTQGASFLRQHKQALPIITKVRAGKNVLTPWGLRMLQYDLRSTDIQALSFHSSAFRQGLADYYRSPYIAGK